jgi:hypothetical protein
MAADRRRLHSAERTVEFHMSHGLGKLALPARALRRGLAP